MHCRDEVSVLHQLFFSNFLCTAHKQQSDLHEKKQLFQVCFLPICFCTWQHSEPLRDRSSLQQWNKWTSSAKRTSSAQSDFTFLWYGLQLLSKCTAFVWIIYTNNRGKINKLLIPLDDIDRLRCSVPIRTASNDIWCFFTINYSFSKK